jgi:hypothetical protein
LKVAKKIKNQSTILQEYNMACVWVEQRKCAKVLGVGVYNEHLTDKPKQHVVSSTSPSKNERPTSKKVFDLDEDRPMTAFDVLTQSIALNFIESSKTGPPKYETSWVPVDAAKHDARVNQEFFQEVTEYVEEQTALFWKCPESYISMQQDKSSTWSGSRNCIIAFEKLVSNFPFLALMPSHSASPANTTETLVFYQLADRSNFGKGVRYTTLSLLVKWFLDLKIMKPAFKKIARDLLVFVYDHSRFLKYHASGGTKQAAQKVHLFSGGSILRTFSSSPKSNDVSIEWLKSVKFDNPRLQTRDLALKILSHPKDWFLRSWYETGEDLISTEPPNIAQFEFRINRASLSVDHIKTSPPDSDVAKKQQQQRPPKTAFAKRPHFIGPSSFTTAWGSKRQKLSQMDILLIVAEELLG